MGSTAPAPFLGVPTMSKPFAIGLRAIPVRIRSDAEGDREMRGRLEGNRGCLGPMAVCPNWELGEHMRIESIAKKVKIALP
jgi:hypothetical protein